jgi:hypothetical protein
MPPEYNCLRGGDRRGHRRSTRPGAAGRGRSAGPASPRRPALQRSQVAPRRGAAGRADHRIQRDGAFRELLPRDADTALAEFPLTSEERNALQMGEVGVLNRMGVHGYLLNTLARYQVFGITAERCMERIRV